MKRILKFSVAFIFLLTLVFFGFTVWGEKWINTNLEAILNQNPDRKYDFQLGEVDFRIFEKSIHIKSLKIQSLLPDTVTHVMGEIEEAMLHNVHLYELLVKKHLLIDELSFTHPTIQVNLFSDKKKKERPGSALQDFFGDILSKGEIKNFQLNQGGAVFFEGGSRKGALYNLGILVRGLETDSLKVQFTIPFDYQKMNFSFDSLRYQLSEEQNLFLGKMQFDSGFETFTLHDVSLKFTEEIRQFARKQEIQKDVIELEFDSLALSGFGPEIRLHADFDVRARKLEVFGLDLTDFREKGLPRGPEVEKPMFQGMISKVDFPLRLDTLKITDSKIRYGESVPQKGEYWMVHFEELNGMVMNLTTIPEYQKEKEFFDMELTTKLENQGEIDLKIKAPYEVDEFEMELDFRDFALPNLNQILRPIMNGEISEGHLERLSLSIHANQKSAQVDLIFDYQNLKLELFNKSGEKKNKLMSSIANLAINHTNMPGDKRYRKPSYLVERMQTRGPFHLIWKSAKEGILQVIPGGAAQELLKSSDK